MSPMDIDIPITDLGPLPGNTRWLSGPFHTNVVFPHAKSPRTLWRPNQRQALMSPGDTRVGCPEWGVDSKPSSHEPPQDNPNAPDEWLIRLPKGSQSALKTARSGREEHPLPDQGSLHRSLAAPTSPRWWYGPFHTNVVFPHAKSPRTDWRPKQRQALMSPVDTRVGCPEWGEDSKTSSHKPPQDNPNAPDEWLIRLPKGSQSALKTARPGRGEHPLPDQGSLHGSLAAPTRHRWWYGPFHTNVVSHTPRARGLVGDPNSAKHSCHPWTRELAATNGGRAVNRVPKSPLKSIPSTPEVCLSSCPRVLKVPSKPPDQGEGSIPSLIKDPCTDLGRSYESPLVVRPVPHQRCFPTCQEPEDWLATQTAPSTHVTRGHESWLP